MPAATRRWSSSRSGTGSASTQLPSRRASLKAWLDAGGDKELVEQPIRNWLGQHETALEASHVYKAWLDAGGDKGLVEQPIRNWLGQHAAALEASHVYKAWLDAGGDKGLVQQPIRNWLGQHATALEASYVYKAWLDAGGDKGLVEQPIRDWLRQHATALEASRLQGLARCRRRQGAGPGADPQLARPARDRPRREFVYKAWLDAGGDKGLVEQPIRNWLECHAESQVADFVMRAWLDAGGDAGLVIDAACCWIATNWHRQEAVYLTKELSKLEALPAAAVKDILRWCCHFPEDEDTLWRLTALFHHSVPAI